MYGVAVRNKYAEKILLLPAAVRRRMRLVRKKRRVNRSKRSFSRQDLIDWAKKLGVKTRKEFYEKRGLSDPTYRVIVQEFGSWVQFKTSVWGEQKVPADLAPVDAAYLAKLVLEFDVWTRAAFERKHKEHPEIFPSYHYVRKEYGRWSNLTSVAEMLRIDRVVNKYVIFRRKHNRWPNGTECRKEMIDLSSLLVLYASKAEMDTMFERMLEIENEK